MLRFYELPATLVEEQKQFETDITEFVKGNINPTKFKAIRVAHGIYEQRQLDTYMVRIRCAASGITPAQLKKVAELAHQYGNGEVHFTTRQEVQIHDVLIDDIMPVIYGLHTVGLSSRGGGGNTIRNILTSVDAGVAVDDVFDVGPYAMALTTRMIEEPDSMNLPRKFKIAFSNNAHDTAFTQATCLGFVPKIQNGQKGFVVYCAGGMGAKPMVGHQLLEFIPDTQVYHVTRAMKTMFDTHGNRRNKHANRLKFLWQKLEREEFVKLFMEEYDKIKGDESLALKLPVLENTAKDSALPVEVVNSSEFDAWKSRFVHAQKQSGLVSIMLPLRLGDILKPDVDRLCDFLSEFGENTIRCERGQNIHLRNIPEKYLGNLFNLIQSMDQPLAKLPIFFTNVVNCTGAQTCKLGLCLPRGLSDVIREQLAGTDLKFDQLSDFRIHMSGCPNTCGLHHIADLGFFGKVGRKDGNLYPAYNVLAGAHVGQAGELQYAQKVSEIPAKFIPNFVYDFLKDYGAKKEKYGTYLAYLDAEGRELIKTLCEQKYKEAPSMETDESFYKDWGAKRKLSLDELGTAECSAGMFDMIDVDKKRIADARKELRTAAAPEREAELLYDILHAASRMLLVTRGLDAKTDEQVFELFNKHFVGTNLVNPKFQDVVVLGKLGLKAQLGAHQESVLEVSDEVVELYKNMDDSLRFKTKDAVESGGAAQAAGGAADVEKDFRSVACPMNFVRTKLALDPMKSGQKLLILLDDGEPVQNVPNSVELEGHKVLEKEKIGGHWKVLIQKK